MNDERRQTLTRVDVIDGLRELVAELRAAGAPARIQIVGGAAITLTLNADRVATVDIDGPLDPAEPILAAARRLADQHGWRQDWINDAAKIFVPTGFGQRAPEWITIHDDGGVHVQIATPETLLAMKLHAAQRRGNREVADLAVLLPTCRITSEQEAEQLYESYYPGDAFTERTAQLVQRILDRGAAAPTPPPIPTLS